MFLAEQSQTDQGSRFTGMLFTATKLNAPINGTGTIHTNTKQKLAWTPPYFGTFQYKRTGKLPPINQTFGSMTTTKDSVCYKYACHIRSKCLKKGIQYEKYILNMPLVTHLRELLKIILLVTFYIEREVHYIKIGKTRREF